ncbi:hypothetical protein GGR51DRAFT_559435 [Nemania sp. FL0031]|nr:hypothetical protein GGR51DRAFT_559435 [Nemania sp. FL0031]
MSANVSVSEAVNAIHIVGYVDIIYLGGVFPVEQLPQVDEVYTLVFRDPQRPELNTSNGLCLRKPNQGEVHFGWIKKQDQSKYNGIPHAYTHPGFVHKCKVLYLARTFDYTDRLQLPQIGQHGFGYWWRWEDNLAEVSRLPLPTREEEPTTNFISGSGQFQTPDVTPAVGGGLKRSFDYDTTTATDTNGEQVYTMHVMKKQRVANHTSKLAKKTQRIPARDFINKLAKKTSRITAQDLRGKFATNA